MATNEQPVKPNETAALELRYCDRRITRLVEQLRRDNKIIAELLEDRQRRRRELLAAQEQKLRALLDDEAEPAQAHDTLVV